MQTKDLFEVAVRIAGVFTLIWGIWDLTNAFLFYADYFRNLDFSFRYYLIYGWVSVFIGLALIKAPGLLVNFAYQEKGDAYDSESNDRESTAK